MKLFTSVDTLVRTSILRKHVFDINYN